jgi:NADPH-dependent 7-cyano-7-deazaguanine reductase QueF-like protein
MNNCNLDQAFIEEAWTNVELSLLEMADVQNNLVGGIQLNLSSKKLKETKSEFSHQRLYDFIFRTEENESLSAGHPLYWK